MLSRKEQNSSGNALPKVWVEEVLNLLDSVYGANMKTLNSFFEVHGFTYPDELYVAVSIIDSNNRAKPPVTLALSTDLTEKTDPKKSLNTIIDSIGVFLDDYFKAPDLYEWQVIWHDTKIKNTTVYYKITREDIGLTIQANELLKEGK